MLPKTIDHPAVSGQVLWARDAYGSRFGVTAAFSAPGGPDRWYLWDIDACGHQAFTVHSGYYPTREAALYHTCSPHRVALTVLHLRDYYDDDFAASLIGLLPDWISWLATRNGTPSQLVERSRPYALGEVHAGVGSDDSRPNYLARVIE